ncbi:MAG: PepSY domain-containing protein [Reyranella sp.]|jgi:uncharacterized membrane protein YkoI|nr:PepSY domain-containing protein [Reyranella sp.]
MRRLLPCLLAAVVACGGAAAAEDDHDQDRARRAVEQGRMLPLREIIARAESAFAGQVVEAELEDERGVPIYEVKVLTRGGRVVKVRYDARTGALLTSNDKDGRR